MGFSRQEYWSRLSFPTLGDLPDPGIKPVFLVSAHAHTHTDNSPGNTYYSVKGFWIISYSRRIVALVSSLSGWIVLDKWLNNIALPQLLSLSLFQYLIYIQSVIKLILHKISIEWITLSKRFPTTKSISLLILTDFCWFSFHCFVFQCELSKT